MGVRGLRPADAAALAPLAEQLGYPTTLAQMDARLRFALSSPGGAAFAAEEGGRLLGWIEVQERRQLESDPFAEITGLVVDETARSRGVGRALVAAAERWAGERGFRELRVRSNVVRERAHRFYEREGFEKKKTSHVLVKAL